MSPLGRPKRESPSAQREGSPVSTPGRSKFIAEREARRASQ